MVYCTLPSRRSKAFFPAGTICGLQGAVTASDDTRPLRQTASGCIILANDADQDLIHSCVAGGRLHGAAAAGSARDRPNGDAHADSADQRWSNPFVWGASGAVLLIGAGVIALRRRSAGSGPGKE